uniref:Ice-structuring protein n=1 Tax=Hydatigena taeniaeformis TaxID=6205 RepID=A0A0R3X0G2_HYDTA
LMVAVLVMPISALDAVSTSVAKKKTITGSILTHMTSN